MKTKASVSTILFFHAELFLRKLIYANANEQFRHGNGCFQNQMSSSVKKDNQSFIFQSITKQATLFANVSIVSLYSVFYN